MPGNGGLRAETDKIYIPYLTEIFLEVCIIANCTVLLIHPTCALILVVLRLDAGLVPRTLEEALNPVYLLLYGGVTAIKICNIN